MPGGPWKSLQLSPKRARYFRSRSASLTDARRPRDAAKSVRPASESERLAWHVRTTSASWTRSNRSSAAHRSGVRIAASEPKAPSISKESATDAEGDTAHASRNRASSFSTVSGVMRPEGESVAIRVIDAARSRKFDFHDASSDVAKAR